MDTTFLIIVLLLLCYGSVMVFSASYAFAEYRFQNSLFFVKKQTLWAAAGIAVMILFSRIDYRILRKFTIPIFCISYVLLWFVFVPGIGSSSHGATRWVDLKIISFQPSDIMKFAIVLLFALYISTYIDKIGQFKYGILIPASILIVVCGSVIVQKHISGTVIIFLIGAVMILVSGASAKWLGGICAAGASVVVSIILFTDYASARVEAWLHPETVLKDGGWQPYQSLLAIGSGGFFGVGLGNSYQKQLWLPEPQNDFIFAIVCEELGFVGGIAVIVLFMALMWRGFYIAKKAPDTFSSLLVTGLVAKVGIQALLNIAVVTTTIPTTGIALPFFSYGGTALIMQLMEMGIVLSVSRYTSQEKV
ncbi:MAG: putative lipid II flippase FtsW [Clostridia bacterium]|nr:putative lipid II flippase FtsW [Clostridia bacterium]